MCNTCNELKLLCIRMSAIDKATCRTRERKTKWERVKTGQEYSKGNRILNCFAVYLSVPFQSSNFFSSNPLHGVGRIRDIGKTCKNQPSASACEFTFTIIQKEEKKFIEFVRSKKTNDL